ncbi:hypothetical protein LXL04_007278 [Taraxacum kok-saghyz]
MIKAHLILSQTRLIFSRLTDFSSVLTEFNSIWSDFWSDSDPNPTRVFKPLNPNFSHFSEKRSRPFFVLHIAISGERSDANPSAPTSSATISVTSYHLRRTFVAIFFLLRRPLSRSSFSRRKPFCSDILCRDLVSPDAKLLCPDIRLLSMAENNKIEEAYVLEIAPMLGRNQWVHIEKTWMSPLWYLWTPWKDLQKSLTSWF